MIRFENVTKTYRTKKGNINAIDDLNLEIPPGEFASVAGPSGCGKSTLLMATGGMLRPSAGKIYVDEQDLYALGQRERAEFRGTQIGFIFQMFHLLPYLNVLENVKIAQRNGGQSDIAADLLQRLGLAHRLTHKPSELSTGERQRTAIARALINTPKLILADEPTGNLDTQNESEVFEVLHTYHKQGGTVVVVSHGEVADQYATRLIRMRDGRIEKE